MQSLFDGIKKNFKLSKEINLEGYIECSLSAFDKSKKVLNFSPGPTALPEDVIKEILDDLVNNWVLGVTPLEISHRSPEFLSIKNNCEDLIKEILEIPQDYSLIWTHGGGHGQFSAVPLNLIKKENDKPKYLVTGTWSNRSFLEAEKFCKPTKSCQNDNLNDITKIDLEFVNSSVKSNDSDYIYICSNETINGLEFREDGLKVPSKEDTNNKIMIVDMSSDIFSKKINWDNIDVAFACAPKNFGFPGSAFTIINNKLLDNDYNRFHKNLPSLLDWKLIRDSDSFWNTLPVFNIYVTQKILSYYKKDGGLSQLEENSKIKAEIIYSILDDNNIYEPIVPKNRPERSRMNIPFYLKNNENVNLLIYNAYINNIVGLKTKTPFSDPNKPEALRISLYNSISIEDTIELALFLKKFNEFIKDS